MKKLFSSGILLLKHENDIRIVRIMKLSAFLILIFTSFAMAENLHSQNAVVSLNKRQVALKEVLDEIEKQTDYLFISNRNINLESKVSIQASKKPVKEVLDKLFTNTELSYSMEGINIILTQKNTTSLPDAIQQQKKTVAGTVKDDFGEPIIGANVIEKGTTNGVITDINGNFSLSVSDDGIIQVSYIGYFPVEVPAKGKTTFNFTLKEDSQTLDEVVVVGFGTQKKANLTGAVSTVKMEDVLGDRPVVSASQALQGAVPGLQITTNTGKPGEAMTFNIRGTNRLDVDGFGAGSPLVLVDNVPMDINMISPADIETVTILKDAASAAIYGARAAFGVILITTKKADKEQKVRVNYNNNFAFTKPQELVEKASPLQTVQLYKDMNYPSGNYTIGGQNIDSWMGYLNDYQSNPGKYPLGYHIDENGNRFDLRETNHLKRIMDDYGFQQTHNVSVDGGTAKTSFRGSFGYLNEDGILITDKDKYNRYNVSSFVNTEINKWLSVQLDVKYAKSTKSEPVLNSLRNWPFFRLAQLLPTYYPEGEVEIGGRMLPIGTPRWNIQNAAPTKIIDQDIRLFGKAILKPFEGLLVNAEFTYNRTNQSIDEYKKKLSYVNAETSTFREMETSGGTSSYKVDNKYVDYKAFNLYANYDKSIGNHNIGLMAGFNQEYSYSNMVWTQRTNVNPNAPAISSADGTMTNGGAYDEFALRGAYYRAAYNYKGKYLLETNGRYDGSSKFPSGHRFGFFPSVSAAWRLSEESFMDWSKNYMDNLKVRASFGQVGNQAIANYAFIGTMGSANGWLGNDGNWNMTYTVPPLFSSNFTWEKVQTIDFGLDLNLFNNRLEMVFDWYIRDTKDMLAPGIDSPSVLGATSPLENSADLRTTGWELSLAWRDRIGKDWRYSVGFNLYDSQSKVTKFDNPTEILSNFRKGQKIGEIWGLVTDRLYTVDDFDVADDATNTYVLKKGIPTLDPYVRAPRPGDILYKDLDGSGAIETSGSNTATDAGDRRVIGNNTRRYNYAINASLGWKGFDLSLFFQGVGKRDLWIGDHQQSNFLLWPHTDTDNPNAPSPVFAHHLNYWTPENQNAYYPRLSNQSGTNQGVDSYNRRIQTKYLQDGSFIKLKNITIGYTVPQKVLEKTKIIRSLKIFFSGEDLWMHHNMFKGMDPEQTPRVTLLYPFMKKYSFGFNVTL